MGGRGKRGKPTTNTRAGAGRGQPGPSAPASNPAGAGRGNTQPAQFEPAPPQSAWGRSAPAAAPVQSAWGRPAPAAAAPVQSAWGRPAPVAAPAQPAWVAPASVPSQTPAPTAPAQVPSAWARGMPAVTQNPIAGQSYASSSPRVAAESRGNGRHQNQPEHSSQQQRTDQQSQRREPLRYTGYNGTLRPDRGSTRGRERMVYPTLTVTKGEGVSKKGTAGVLVPLTTNYFRINKKPQWQLYQYVVAFSPPIEHIPFAKKLINDQKPNLGAYLFDGSILFLCVKLHREETEFNAIDRDGKHILITVKFVKMVSMLTGEAIHVLNLIMRRTMAALNLQLVGRSFFDCIRKINIPAHNLQLWPGYDTSIRQHEVDILMCAQVTHKVMRTETIRDIMRKIHVNSTDEDYKREVCNAILGMTVLTEYNNKTYKIDDVHFDMSPKDEFDTKHGTKTFVEYYRDKHGIIIKDKDQPLLITRSKERDIRGGQPDHILLIPELCRATGFTSEMRSNRTLMEDVAKYTRLDPAARIEKLRDFNDRLQNSADSVRNFQEWDFRLDKNLVQVNGRQLPSEVILFGQNKTMATNDWSKAFHNFSMYFTNPLHNWVLIVPRKKSKEARDFVGILQRTAKGMKYPISDPHYIDIQEDFGRNYSMAIDTALQRDPQLVMCIMMNLSSDKYSMIKKKCCVDRAIPSQVMLSRTITPRPGKNIDSLMSVGTKVTIQLNAKLGGAPWMVNIPLSGLMVVGFDVCHDTNDRSKSFGALVASMDMKVSGNYFSAVSPHRNGEELSNFFGLNLVKALRCFGEVHGSYPQSIFIYRDGVGEGQTEFVREHEIKCIKAKLMEVYKSKESLPKLLFIVVSKRINTRFFNGGRNPGAGTIVDDIVTLPERHDFFLISQSVRTGTVSPTNYNILYNSSGLSSDKIQMFTYKMTHLYYNWTGTLALPAVCQYAHKLAFLVGTFIHRAPLSQLEKQLYFL